MCYIDVMHRCVYTEVVTQMVDIVVIHRCGTLAPAVDVLRYIDVSTERWHTDVIHRCLTQMLYIKVIICNTSV